MTTGLIITVFVLLVAVAVLAGLLVVYRKIAESAIEALSFDHAKEFTDKLDTIPEQIAVLRFAKECLERIRFEL